MREDYAQRVVRRLRSEGLKITPQRVAVLRCLEGNRSHPSVDEIHKRVSREFPTISLATVYNTLDTLERIGEVQAVTIDPQRKHYDPDNSAHHHFICSECRDIQDVFADYTSALQVPEELAGQFRVDSASVCFKGVCRTCAGGSC